MIEVGTLHRFVFQATGGFLTLKNGIALHCLLVVEVLTSIDIPFSFQCYVNQLKASSLPEVVAGIYQLVDPTIEASLFSELSVCEPLYKPIDVDLVLLS